MHHPHELREGLGRRVPAPDGHLDAVLDRAAPERAAPVARPRAHADGLAPAALQLHVVMPARRTHAPVLLSAPLSPGPTLLTGYIRLYLAGPARLAVYCA